MWVADIISNAADNSGSAQLEPGGVPLESRRAALVKVTSARTHSITQHRNRPMLYKPCCTSSVYKLTCFPGADQATIFSRTCNSCTVLSTL